MRRLILLLAGLALLAGCRNAPAQKEAGYIVQVSLGGWHSPDYTAEQIMGRIDTVAALIPVKKVIIGWSVEPELYREVGEHLHAKGIEMLLWLPVFAETEEVCDNAPALDLWGEVPAHYDLAAGEGFRFNCPTNPQNQANVVGIYDRFFADCGFDGVFLDRIRTQSFVSGASGVLSCGCPGCEKHFAAEGVSLEAVRKEWEAKGDAFFSVTGYTPATGFTFENPVAESFFRAKGHIVSGAVAAVADSLRSRGLSVGMDLYDLLRKAAPGAAGYPEFAMDVDFLDSQLEAMEPYPCAKYPGIEINYREGIVPTSPAYVTESLDAVLRHGFEGAVLSWNIMEAPEAHIACLK